MNWPSGSYTGYAIFCLNALVGNIDAPGGVIYQETPKYKNMPPVVKDPIAQRSQERPRLDFRGKDKFPAAEIVPNLIPESVVNDTPYPIEMAIGFNSNFNMVAPAPKRWEAALRKIPYYAHISPFGSEMAQYADLVLPSTTFLEEWGYDHSPAGSGFAELRIKQPVVRPRGQAKSIPDVLFELAGRLKGGVAASFTDIGDGARGFVKFRTGTLLPWEEFLEKGVWIGPKYQYKKYDRLFKTPSKKFEFCSGNLKGLHAQTGGGAKDELDFLPHHTDVEFLGDPKEYQIGRAHV
jgi:anaerobic selenocysteine-containing dehydrogenase